jgi:hypothetical protein
MELEHAKRVGIAAAYAGAQVVRDRFGNISQIDKKGAFNLLPKRIPNPRRKLLRQFVKHFRTMPF